MLSFFKSPTRPASPSAQKRVEHYENITQLKSQIKQLTAERDTLTTKYNAVVQENRELSKESNDWFKSYNDLAQECGRDTWSAEDSENLYKKNLSSKGITELPMLMEGGRRRMTKMNETCKKYPRKMYSRSKRLTRLRSQFLRNKSRIQRSSKRRSDKTVNQVKEHNKRTAETFIMI